MAFYLLLKRIQQAGADWEEGRIFLSDNLKPWEFQKSLRNLIRQPAATGDLRTNHFGRSRPAGEAEGAVSRRGVNSGTRQDPTLVFSVGYGPQ